MICSFVLGLYPEKENKIYKYINYDYLKEIFLDAIELENLKKITVSNFFTKDSEFKKKTYYMKISSIDSEITIKLLKILFLYKITNRSIFIKNNNFKIVNIYHNSIWAKQLNIEKYDDEELKNEIEIKILTPMFFKIGNQFLSSVEPMYILKNIIKKIKKSSLYTDKVKEYIKRFDINKVVIIEKNIDYNILSKYKVEAITGSIKFRINDYTNEELLFFNLLLQFSFFSGIGYLTEKGYGQVKILEIRE